MSSSKRGSLVGADEAPAASAMASVVGYSLCSATMLIANKLATFYIPAPGFVASIQMVVCCAVVAALHFAPNSTVEVERPTQKNVVPYMRYAALFAVSIFTNIHALQHSNVETVIVFRSASPIAVALCDSVFMGRELPSKRSASGLLLILGGAVGYVMCDTQFAMESFWAYQWAFSYLIVTVAIMTYGKYLLQEVQLSLSGSVAYSNALSLPVMLVLMVVGNEVPVVLNLEYSGMGMWWLTVSCVVGTSISYAGWWCRSQISATSFTVVGVVNKALTLTLNRMIAWGNESSILGLGCLLVAIGGGLIYQQAPIRPAGASAQTGKVMVMIAGGALLTVLLLRACCSGGQGAAHVA